MPEPVRHRSKMTQSGIFSVGYRIEILDAGVLMTQEQLSLQLSSGKGQLESI